MRYKKENTNFAIADMQVFQLYAVYKVIKMIYVRHS